MREGWKVKKLIEVCEKITDGTHRTPTYFDDGVLFLSSRNVTSGTIDWENVKYIDAKQHGEMQRRVSPRLNDILLAKNGTTGVAAMVDRDVPFDIYVSLALLRPLATVHPTFLLHFINSPLAKKQFTKRLKGVGVPNLHLEEIREVEIPIPPLPEQQRIVGILDKAFAGLAVAVANAEKNLQNARALFESHLQSVFTQRGDGWEENSMPLSEMCELIVDCEHKTAPIQEEGYPSIRTPNIGKGTLLLEGVNRVSEETYRAWTRRAEPLPGDLILAREAPAGNVAIIPDNTRVCLGQRTVLIRPKSDIFDSSFLAFRLLEPLMQQKLLAHSRGATVQHVNMKDIRALEIGRIPPLHVQKRIATNIAAVSAEGERLATIYERKLAALLELKKSLLHQAFSGEL